MRSFGSASYAPALGRPSAPGRSAFGAPSSNPYLKKRGYYKDTKYAYYVDPKKWIIVYQGGKELKRIEATSAKYAAAYESLFGPKARDGATPTTREGAGLPPLVDPKIVAEGLTAAGLVTVAALGGRKKKKRKKGAATETPAGDETEAPSALPRWLPWAAGGALLLVVVGIGLTSGRAKPTTDTTPKAP